MQIEATRGGKLIKAQDLEALNSENMSALMKSLQKYKLEEGMILELDLSRTTNITSRGLAVLLHLYGFCKDSLCQIVITAINKKAASVFRLLRLTRFFDIREKGALR